MNMNMNMNMNMPVYSYTGNSIPKKKPYALM